ncbi:MAG: DUF4397 domain-containing protein [Bryobacteraceae bacterium]|nr:DUF4397 domain-containing protein [Bryobacteraceae bacterium]
MFRNLVLVSLAMATLSFAQTTGRVRVLHASPDAPAVDILVNGAIVIEALPFREYTEYLPVPAGAQEIRVNVTGTTTTVLRANPMIAAGVDYTAIATGFATPARTPALDLLLLRDDNTLAPNNGVKFRIVHGAASAPAVDIYLTTPFETIRDKQPGLSAVPFGAVSPYLSVPVSLYQARVAVAGTKTVAIDSHRLVTWNNMVRTIVAVDNRGGGAPFDLLILPDRN